MATASHQSTQPCRLHAVRVEKLLLRRRQSLRYPPQLLAVGSGGVCIGRPGIVPTLGPQSARRRHGHPTAPKQLRAPCFSTRGLAGPRLIDTAKHAVSSPFLERSNLARAEVLHKRPKHITLTCGPARYGPPSGTGSVHRESSPVMVTCISMTYGPNSYRAHASGRDIGRAPGARRRVAEERLAWAVERSP